MCERLLPQREKLEQRKGTGEVTYVTEPVPARSAEWRYIEKTKGTIIARGARGGHYLMRLFPYALPGSD